jgi:hypothetical protein
VLVAEEEAVVVVMKMEVRVRGKEENQMLEDTPQVIAEQGMVAMVLTEAVAKLVVLVETVVLVVRVVTVAERLGLS